MDFNTGQAHTRTIIKKISLYLYFNVYWSMYFHYKNKNYIRNQVWVDNTIHFYFFTKFDPKNYSNPSYDITYVSLIRVAERRGFNWSRAGGGCPPFSPFCCLYCEQLLEKEAFLVPITGIRVRRFLFAPLSKPSILHPPKLFPWSCHFQNCLSFLCSSFPSGGGKFWTLQ